MNIRNISGIILLLAGGALFFFSNYIADEVEKGKEQIVQGQKKVDQIEDVTALSPYTKGAGSMIAKSGQKKIDAGKQEVAEYEDLANKLHLGGVGLLVLGGGLVLVSFIRKKK